MLKPRILVLALLLGLTACEETPTGRSQLALVPESVMADLGQKAFAQIKQAQPVASNPVVNRSVQCVADEIIKAATELYPPEGMPDSWEVAVFDDPTPNAFALPGGKIGVHTGLLKVARTPAQLAAVIGHEVAHVLADHGNERLTQELGIEAGLFVAGLLAEGELDPRTVQEVLGIGAQLGVALPFSRAHEREADLLGLDMMAAAGFDPRQSVVLWRNMAEAGGNQPLEFLSTHPAHDTRIEQLQAQMEKALARYQQAEPAGCLELYQH